MQGISAIGYPAVYAAALLVLVHAVDYRRGLFMVHLMLGAGLTVLALKNAFALPRPFAVDAGVQAFDLAAGFQSTFIDAGGVRFFDLPAGDSIALYRDAPPSSFGFPSGHVLGALAFWGGLWVVYRRRVFGIVCLAVAVLMPISRMYLGVHFLGDVLLGAVLGGLSIGAAHLLYTGRPWARAHVAAWSLFFIPAALMVAGGDRFVPYPLLGAAAALPLGTLLVRRAGVRPRERGALGAAAARVALATACTATSGLPLWWMAGSLPPVYLALAGAAPMLVFVWGVPLMNQHLGLYRPASR